MGTQSSVSVVHSDGSVISSMGNYDGHIDFTGMILAKHYASYDKALNLIECGDFSMIGSKLDPTPGSGHSFANPEKDVTVFYHRDRGEPTAHTKARNFCSIEETIKAVGCEYNYFYMDGQWVVFFEGLVIPLAKDQEESYYKAVQANPHQFAKSKDVEKTARNGHLQSQIEEAIITANYNDEDFIRAKFGSDGKFINVDLDTARKIVKMLRGE